MSFDKKHQEDEISKLGTEEVDGAAGGLVYNYTRNDVSNFVQGNNNTVAQAPSTTQNASQDNSTHRNTNLDIGI
jgi:hypothetical protein